ncbi:MAG: hypothetical protein MI810_07655 [Flavobacteriales bacterium]|nr:hypothetical protein [Flavobacteriales bacterium]
MRSYLLFVIVLLQTLVVIGQCEELCGYRVKYEALGKMDSLEGDIVHVNSVKNSALKVGHTGLLYQELDSKGADLPRFQHFDEFAIPESWMVIADVKVIAIKGDRVSYQIMRPRYDDDGDVQLRPKDKFEAGYTMVFRAYNYTNGKWIKQTMPDGGWGEGCGCDNRPDGKWKYYDENGKPYKEVWMNWKWEEGPVTLFNENGDTISVGMYDRYGKKKGEWREFFPTGELAAVNYYRRGNQYGKQELYHPNGQMMSSGVTDHWGKREGMWYSYYSDGQLKSKIFYDNGEFEGVYEEFWEDGSFKTKGMYDKWGDRQTAWQEFHKNGELRKELRYDRGELTSGKEWFDNGNLAIEYKLSGFGDTTNYAEFYENGNLKLLEEFSRKRRSGPYAEYYENGKVKVKGEYRLGIPNGEWSEYYEDGQLKSTKRLDIEGRIDGKFQEFYSNGQLKTAATYSDGYLVNSYLSYYENGQIKEAGRYLNNGEIFHLSSSGKGERKQLEGKKTGKWVEYYDDGSIKSSGKYEVGNKVGKWTFQTESGEKTKEKF